MPRLALSLPAELGSAQGNSSRSSGSWRSVFEWAGRDRPASDDAGDEPPPIESWLACWSAGKSDESEENVTESQRVS